MALSRAELLALPPVVPLWPVAGGQALGLSRPATYRLAKDGRFPIRVLKIGERYAVARADLLRFLGETDDVPRVAS